MCLINWLTQTKVPCEILSSLWVCPCHLCPLKSTFQIYLINHLINVNQTKLDWINIRKNWRGNQEWTIQRHCKHWVHKTQDDDKQNTHKNNTTQKTKKMNKQHWNNTKVVINILHIHDCHSEIQDGCLANYAVWMVEI